VDPGLCSFDLYDLFFSPAELAGGDIYARSGHVVGAYTGAARGNNGAPVAVYIKTTTIHPIQCPAPAFCSLSIYKRAIAYTKSLTPAENRHILKSATRSHTLHRDNPGESPEAMTTDNKTAADFFLEMDRKPEPDRKPERAPATSRTLAELFAEAEAEAEAAPDTYTPRPFVGWTDAELEELERAQRKEARTLDDGPEDEDPDSDEPEDEEDPDNGRGWSDR
jgi:hypothetical protein